MGIQADWVEKTPEEYAGEKEFTVKFTMSGEITLFAKDREDAIDKAKELSNIDLLDCVDDIDLFKVVCL